MLQSSPLVIDYPMIIGIDEVGRGAAVGELVVCGVRAPEDWRLEGLADSKVLKAAKRAELDLLLRADKSISFHLAQRSNKEIDDIGLGKCLKSCYVEIINVLWQEEEDKVILDGNLSPRHLIPEGLKPDVSYVSSIIKADATIPCVSAASIIAKEFRDTMIREYALSFPEYEWKTNVGYLSKAHISAIKQFGLTLLHRKSYKLKLI